MSQPGSVNIPPQVAESFVANIGSAAPVGGVLNIVGGAGITTTATGNTVTITNTDAISTLAFKTSSGNATSSAGAITFTGTGGLQFSGAGSTVTGILSAIPNASLANSSIMINAGTGLSGGGTVSLGGSVTITGQNPITTTQFDVLVGGAGNTISGVGPGTAGQIFQSGGASANPAYSTTTYPSTNAISTLLYASSANVMSALATVNSAVLTTSSGGVPTWSTDLGVGLGGTGNNTFTAYSLITAGTTATGAFQNVVGVGATGTILTSAGASALPAWTTTTYPATNAINTLLYASAANVMSALATANNGTLITSGAGVPSISSTLPTAVQGNITSTGNLGNQINTTRSMFSAFCSANKTNVTGDGTAYNILFDTKIVDQATNYATATGLFTAPVTGNYMFNVNIYLSGLASGAVVNLYFVSTTVALGYLHYGVTTQSSGIEIMNGSIILNLAATNTVGVQLIVNSQTKVVNVVGAAIGSGPSIFSGYLIC